MRVDSGQLFFLVRYASSVWMGRGPLRLRDNRALMLSSGVFLRYGGDSVDEYRESRS